MRIEGQGLPASPELARAVIQDKRRARAVLEALSLSFTTTRAPVVLAEGMHGERGVDVMGGAFTAHGSTDGSMSYSESSDLMVSQVTARTVYTCAHAAKIIHVSYHANNIKGRRVPKV